MKPLASISLTLCIGLIGAVTAWLLHLPVPALIGSAIFVSIVAFSSIKVSIPSGMRNLGFTILGCSMGSGITPDVLEHVSHWPVSLLLLALAVVTMTAASTFILSRFFGQHKVTGLLASIPGALAVVMSLSDTVKSDARAIVVLQSIRLLVVMSIIPIVISGFGLQSSIQISSQPALIISATLTVLLVLLSLGLALLFSRLKVPAAYLLSGLTLSGIAHLTGWLQGGLPPFAIQFAFLVVGCAVGARFLGVALHELRQYSVAALICVSLSSFIAAVFASITTWLLDLPFGQVWVAYAPGGVEAMAALALALDYDPTYIATHHLFRIIAITLSVPWILRYISRNEM